ncbi:DsrE family protein [Acidithiobacillus sp. IBUN Pt1247-S3]|uniref:DsrE family protein n=1 Tax=Acidithiobacillus sp. IBUN Pt1247-S3 TaxID=3166642 RepID=UPI0034E54F41
MPSVTALVFHIDEAGRWPLLLGNLRNALRADPATKLRVIANGAAPIPLWANGLWRRETAALIAQGVEFFFCQNSLVAYELDAADRPEGSHLAPAGVLALAEAQQQGFAYIKP